MEIQPRYTLCFIQHDQKYLMLYRNKEPNKGKWNGVGGKIEPGETPQEACLREIYEETGLIIPTITFRGLVYWNNEGGMYVYLAETAKRQVSPSHEGRLEWKTLDWILTSPQVVSNIPLFLVPMLDKERPPQKHAFFYNEQGKIIRHEMEDLDFTYQATLSIT